MIFDGGNRRGTDVFRALALGTTAVARAQPALYDAALGEPPGVASVLEHLQDELRSAMLLVGTQMVTGIKRDSLHVRSA